MQQRSLQQVRVSVSLIFLIHGLIIATWASRIPAFGNCFLLHIPRFLQSRMRKWSYGKKGQPL
jgi:hypothetical protein